MSAEEMTIQREGAQLFRVALSIAQLSELERTLSTQPRDHAGVRLSGIPELRPILSPTGPVGTPPLPSLVPSVFRSAQFSSRRIRIRTGL